MAINTSSILPQENTNMCYTYEREEAGGEDEGHRHGQHEGGDDGVGDLTQDEGDVHVQDAVAVGLVGLVVLIVK